MESEGREVRVMSCITPVFEGIFSYSKIAVFSGACDAPIQVNHIGYVLTTS